MGLISPDNSLECKSKRYGLRDENCAGMAPLSLLLDSTRCERGSDPKPLGIFPVKERPERTRTFKYFSFATLERISPLNEVPAGRFGRYGLP